MSLATLDELKTVYGKQVTNIKLSWNNLSNKVQAIGQVLRTVKKKESPLSPKLSNKTTS